ncbi:MAG: FAD-dependent oxidoreductase [Planctomycetaceae bacterium]
MDDIACDTLIIGGGAAGLWLLDELARRGSPALLLECHALGAGQTIAAQGILHSGLKYTLHGLLTTAAREARDMPALWNRCLRGQVEPDLRGVRIRSPHCHLWRTNDLSSRLGLFGACVGLRVNPEIVPVEELPGVFHGCPGPVARVAEPVVSPQSLLETLAARNQVRIARIDTERDMEFDLAGPGVAHAVRLHSPERGQTVRIWSPRLVLTAGAGNARLRERLGLDPGAMQRRPLHMVLVRGNLPECFGHCVDGAATRATITSDTDSAGRTVWQLGGQISEAGVRLDPPALIAHAQSELRAVLPGLNLTGTEWATYRIDRAEGATPGGSRPDSIRVILEGQTLTAWPTKLVLVPQLARTLAETIASARSRRTTDFVELAEWPRPAVALPPWERAGQWERIERTQSHRDAA